MDGWAKCMCTECTHQGPNCHGCLSSYVRIVNMIAGELSQPCKSSGLCTTMFKTHKPEGDTRLAAASVGAGERKSEHNFTVA